MGGQEVLIGASQHFIKHRPYVLRDYDNTLPIFLEVPRNQFVCFFGPDSIVKREIWLNSFQVSIHRSVSKRGYSQLQS